MHVLALDTTTRDGSVALVNEHRVVEERRGVGAPPFSPERLVEVEGAIVGDPGATLTRWRHLRDASVVFVGDGAALYADAIGDHQAIGWEVLSEPALLAGAIGRMAVARAQRGDVIHPAAVQPLYVRRSDAEIERERKTLEHNGHKGH